MTSTTIAQYSNIEPEIPNTAPLPCYWDPRLQYSPAEPEILNTATAAAFLNRKPQTLRKWACHECGPIRPVRIYGRLGWRKSDLQALLSQGAAK